MLNNKGFTLIELMISVTIMVVLLAVAAPNYSSWMANTRIRNSAENSNIAVTLARTTAIRTNSIVDLSFNSDGTWRIKDSKGGTLYSSDKNTRSSSIVMAQKAKSCSADSGTPPNTISFNGLGSLTSYSSYELNFKRDPVKESDTPYTVMVSPGGSSLLCLTNGSSTNPQSCVNVKGGC